MTQAYAKLTGNYTGIIKNFNIEVWIPIPLLEGFLWGELIFILELLIHNGKDLQLITLRPKGSFESVDLQQSNN